MQFCVMFSSFVTFILGMITLSIGLKYNAEISAVESNCYVKQVIYPTSIDSTVGFTTCDCGRHCTSDRGICISIFGNTDNSDSMVKFNDKVGNNINECTFDEKNCRKGESISDRLKAIENANVTVQPYLNSIYNNETINCYKYNEDIYLNNDPMLEILIILGSITGFFLLISITFCYRYKNYKKVKPTTNSNFDEL